MSCYRHLTIEERESLMLFREKGESIREISRKLHRAPSTISRELKRNEEPYRASASQERYRTARKRSVRHSKLEDRECHRSVHFLLGYLWWSPEQIANRLREEGTACISTSTIYRALDNNLLQDTLRYYLRIKYKTLGKSKKPSRLCFQKSITLRSEAANTREEAGHWEGDTIHSSNEKDSIVTLVDRRSRFLLCEKVPNKESGTIRAAIVNLLVRSKLPVKSITFDQGSEFAEGAGMERDLAKHNLDVDVYFAHPHAPWERPTNENTNGLIRQFVPKRSKVSELTEQDIRSIAAKLNFRPRECLGWKTPYEVAFDQVLHLT